MNNEFNMMISQDLAEVSGPIMRMLIEQDNYNLRGIGALLQLAACMMGEGFGRVPNDAEHALADATFKEVASNEMALVSFVAQLAKGCILVHHGYGRKHGSIRKES